MTTKTMTEPPLLGLAEIHLLPGQYIVRYREQADIITKAVAPETLRAAFLNEPVDSGWLDPRIRRWGHVARGQFAVLVLPAQTYALRLTNLSKEHSGNGRARITVALPAFIFAGLGQHYAVWALADENPSPAAQAYRAPLPNVHANGAICWGNNTPPSCSPENIGPAWQMFIGSPFNNHLMGGSSQAFDKDVREQLLRTAQRDAMPYPLADLVATHHTVNAVVSQFIGSGGDGD